MTDSRVCPRDGAALAPKKYEADIEIDECAKCGGVWLDAGELEAIQRTIERDHSGTSDADDAPTPSAIMGSHREAMGAVHCLVCNAVMEARAYGYGSQVEVDVCPEGCGVWLDYGELQSLERHSERGEVDAELPPHWRVWAAIVGTFRRRKG